MKFFKPRITFDEINIFINKNNVNINELNMENIKMNYYKINNDKDKILFILAVLEYNKNIDYRILRFFNSELKEKKGNFSFDKKLSYFHKNNTIISKEDSFYLDSQDKELKFFVSFNLNDYLIPFVENRNFILNKNYLIIKNSEKLKFIKTIKINKIINPVNNIGLNNIEQIRTMNNRNSLIYISNQYVKNFNNIVFSIEENEESLIIYYKDGDFYEQ